MPNLAGAAVALKNTARRYRPLVIRVLAAASLLRGLPSYFRILHSGRKMRASNLARRDRRVVFVCERPGQREAKMAFGLRQAGWDVVLIHRKPPSFTDLRNFVEIHRYTSPWHGVELAHRAGARLFHVFSPNCDNICMRMIDRKPGKVIVDFYDNFFSLSDGLPAMEAKYVVDIARQRYCIDRADGVCCRDLQMQYRRRETKVARGIPTLYFPEYCWNTTPLPEQISHDTTDIVQIGWMGLETRGVEDVGSFLILSKFVEAGCDIHIYLHPTFPPIGSESFRLDFRDYLDLASTTGRVHFHQTLPADRLISEITRYDLGINIPNATMFDMPWKTHNPRHLRFAGSSRMFDYLDAGLLQLVCHPSALVRRQFRSAGTIIDGVALLRSGKVKAGTPHVPRERLAAARKSLSVAVHIHRLIAFYERLT